MRGDHDAILRWPFPYKVKLTLIDQGALNESQRHITDFFWPDLLSNCFRRPDSNMNNAYGFQTFLSLEQLKQYGHLYISNNAMFFKAEIDYRSEIPGIITFASY
jgi:TNF receptor-associated factor 2/TNF receptor-associated factor 3